MEEYSKKNYDIVVDLDFSVTESRRNPYFNMVKEEQRFFLKAISSEYTARQQAPEFYEEDFALMQAIARYLFNKDEKFREIYHKAEEIMEQTKIINKLP